MVYHEDMARLSSKNDMGVIEQGACNDERSIYGSRRNQCEICCVQELEKATKVDT